MLLLAALSCQTEPTETGESCSEEVQDGFDNDCDGLIDEDQPATVAYEGCGEQTVGGAGGSVVVVESLADDGPGTLRAAIEGHDGTPLHIRFAVGGTITIDSPLHIQQPWLTISGSDAPAPGITLQRGEDAEGILLIKDTEQIILSHLRFRGRWEPGEEPVGDVGTFQVIGSREAGSRHIVLDHLTTSRANDYGPDIWGTVSDVTVSWSFFFNNRHPMTISHHPTPFLARDCISIHHNVFADNGERTPQARGDVQRLDVVNNLIYGWGWVRDDRGYGIRIRSEEGEPAVSGNIVANDLIATRRPESALVYGEEAGPEDDGTLGALYVADNRLPEANLDGYTTTTEPIAVPAVTTWAVSELPGRLLDEAGGAHRTAEESALLETISATR